MSYTRHLTFEDDASSSSHKQFFEFDSASFPLVSFRPSGNQDLVKLLCLVLWAFPVVSLLADNAPTAKQPIQLQIMQPDAVQEDLYGKVKSVKATSYKSTDGTKGAVDGKTLDTYNKQGCTLEKSSWNETGVLENKIVSTYDAQGNFLTRQGFGANGELVSSCTLTFDPAAKKITSEIHNPDGSLNNKTISIYDDYGKEHDVTHFDSSGNMTGRTTMQRDYKGKEISVIFYGKNNDKETTISVRWYPDGSQEGESISEDANGVTTEIKYDYPERDSHGNWTTRIKKTDFQKEGESIEQSELITERVITYY
ncbi:MAG: hypothetical protein LV480_00320 [Methylacidiphilales bacterium]|nr:hypothetical protein [Candidatus Methylacidiphilales bacterium]